MNFIGRLAQRLERSVYTRKVVRSNRTVPTIFTKPSWILAVPALHGRTLWVYFYGGSRTLDRQ